MSLTNGATVRWLKYLWQVPLEAFRRFLADDGWAIASHIALSGLMSLFPFLIVVTALAGFFFGSKQLADEAAKILLQAWPAQVAQPLAADIEGVLTNLKGGILTFGVIFAIYFASSGVESLRIGLNRAYDIREERAWWLLRLESVLYVLVGAVALLVFAFMVVLAPFIWARLVGYLPALGPFGYLVAFVRVTTAAVVIVIALTIMHLWLPCGRRRMGEVTPGIVATLVLWLASGEIFGQYLAEFAYGYVTMYAGLASAMIALVFLYICSCIFIYGGELNSVICKVRQAQPAQASSTSS